MRKFICGIFDDEEKILNTTRAFREKGIEIYDVFTPYAVHGLDEAMGIKRSRLPIVCFIAGSIGFLLSLLFQVWVFTRDWPIIVGGKPYNAVPAFIPVSFEMTVLLGGVITALVFFMRCRLFPGKKPCLFDPAITRDRFVFALEKVDARWDLSEVSQMLRSFGALEVEEKEICS